MNGTTKIIAAAFISMLACSVAAAYTPDYDQIGRDGRVDLQDVYDQTMRERKQATQDSFDAMRDKRELERTIDKRIRRDRECPNGIPVRREPISYGRRTVEKEPDRPSEPEPLPGLHGVFVVIVIVVAAILKRCNR